MPPVKIMTLLIMTTMVVAHAAAETSNRSRASAHIFGPGVISGPDGDMAPSFASGGSRLYFTRSYPDTSAIMISDKKGASWSTPVVAAFSGHWRDLELAIAPSGAYAIFASNRPHPGQTDSLHATYFGQPQSGGNLWKIDFESGSSVPYPLPPSVNDGNSVWTPSISGNNNLYFMKTDSVSGRFRLHVANDDGGKYRHVDTLPFSTGAFNDVDPSIDTNEKFLVFSSDRGASVSGSKPGPERLFIAFNPRSPDALVCAMEIPGWTNKTESQIESRFSPDERTLYFSSRHPDNAAGRSAKATWNQGSINIWMIPFQPDLWRTVEGASPACRAHA
ncbi:WD40-like Beta Propeller Repeat [Rhodanobacter sp. OK091]|nr:WD40-like Beta Propeller Repeat [Rhodanobacter sp. OK091]